MSNDDTSPPGPEDPPDDGSEMYGVFGEGKPRHIVGDSDLPPRRRPRKKPGGAAEQDR
jgi:hypothetical protein